MNQLDVYYRALSEYRKLTLANSDCTSFRSAIAAAGIEQDKIEIKRAYCTIEEDWVEAIEKGLVHIEKAIKEDRQFIRSNGEIIPIEKVKHVSRESVEHLAKHSNLITRYEEGEDIIPDSLYAVERLNDYTVYENRFLYMLLCYLRDFVTLRYNDIVDLTHKYEATVTLDKKVSTGKNSLTYTLEMHEMRRNDPYLKERNPSKRVIDRIDLILKAILAFLATPLMETVAKAPMLKPPITKTNVLKMNNNFKGAVALYDFIVSYDKPGYFTEYEINNLAPFKEELADELAEAGALVSFLTYEYGLKINQELKESYALEEERIKDEQIQKRAERIQVLKHRLEESGTGIEEYVVTLEKQIRAFESERVRAQVLAEEIVQLKEDGKKVSDSLEAAKEDIEKLNTQISEEKQRHFEEVEALKKSHEDAMHELIEAHEKKIAELLEEFEGERERHAREIEEIRKAAEEQCAALREECEKTVEEANLRVTERNNALSEKERECAELLEANLRGEARIKALGGVERDMTDRDSFNKLENEYNAFKRLYKEQWEKTKKQIRQKHLNTKNIRGNKENESSD